MGSEIRTSSAVGLAWTETETLFKIDDIGSHLETFSHKKILWNYVLLSHEEITIRLDKKLVKLSFAFTYKIMSKPGHKLAYLEIA